MKWFKHDSDANMSSKLQNVILDYGMEGYGLYWFCVELIANRISSNNVTFELEHDARVIAKNSGLSVHRTEEIMKYFIELELFECSAGAITCMSLLQRLDVSMTGNLEMRKTIQRARNAHAESTVMTESEQKRLEEKRLEEIRLDKIRLDKIRLDNISKSTKRFKKPKIEEIRQYFLEKTSNFDYSSAESEKFYDFYESKNWLIGKNKMSSWKNAASGWYNRSKPVDDSISLDWIKGASNETGK